MIVYVSPSEKNGGILQFSTSITRETKALKECKLFLPNVVDKKLFGDIAENVVTYSKVKTFRNNHKGITDIAKKIISLSPKTVIFLEDSILMQQINLILHKNGIKTAMVIHDIKHHPYRKMGAREIIVDIFRRKMMRKTIKKCHRIILLSNNSEQAFKDEYKSSNTVVFKLPAHVPNATDIIPTELDDISEKFFLFFGRIDEYKGIGQMCSAYSKLSEEVKSKTPVVIAGKGYLSDMEKSLIEAEPHIHLISRFIDDGEMIYLFKNAKAVLLPYIEASQSGVLPISYKFGVPVIVSNLNGLTENVSVNKTGYVFDDVEELTKILCEFDESNFLKEEIYDFCENNFSWKNNLEKLIKILE